MFVSVNENFKRICIDIVAQDRNDDEWALVQSDDMFQLEEFEGGYEALERAFCFSYYAADSKEYWFQLTLPEIKEVADGKRSILEVNPSSQFSKTT